MAGFAGERRAANAAAATGLAALREALVARRRRKSADNRRDGGDGRVRTARRAPPAGAADDPAAASEQASRMESAAAGEIELPGPNVTGRLHARDRTDLPGTSRPPRGVVVEPCNPGVGVNASVVVVVRRGLFDADGSRAGLPNTGTVNLRGVVDACDVPDVIGWPSLSMCKSISFSSNRVAYAAYFLDSARSDSKGCKCSTSATDVSSCLRMMAVAFLCASQSPEQEMQVGLVSGLSASCASSTLKL